MNREIKFRAWDGARNAWLHEAKTPDMAVHLDGETIMFGELWRRPDDSSVPMDEMNQVAWMQFTGLKDKNSKEIYEGDIIKLVKDPLSNSPWDNFNAEVTFEDGMYVLAKRTLYQASTLYQHTFEVIGNRWETPELLTTTL